jgi:hypothetical protein
MMANIRIPLVISKKIPQIGNGFAEVDTTKKLKVENSKWVLWLDALSPDSFDGEYVKCTSG